MATLPSSMSLAQNFTPSTSAPTKPSASSPNQSFGTPSNVQTMTPSKPVAGMADIQKVMAPSTKQSPVVVSTSKGADSHIQTLGSNIQGHIDNVNNHTQAKNNAQAVAATSSTNPVSSQTNAQGLTPQQMSQIATKQMQDRTIAASQANPGQLQVGGQTGSIPTAAGNQPVTFQAMTGQADVQKQQDLQWAASQRLGIPLNQVSQQDIQDQQGIAGSQGSATPSQQPTGQPTSTPVGTPGATTTPQGMSSGTTGTTSLQQDQNTPEAKLQSLNAQTDQAYNDYKSQIDSIHNGTFPLNPLQQATISSITNNFNQLRQVQMVANQNYTGAITQAGVTSGRSRYAPEIEAGNIMQAVSTGIAKIAKIDSDASQALVQAQTAFQKEDYAEATDAYDKLQKHLDDKTNQLTKLMEVSQKAVEAAQKQSMEMEKFKYQQEQDSITNTIKLGEFDAKQKQQAFDQIMASDKFDYQQKKDAIDQQLASDKFTWDQKKAMIDNALANSKFSYEQEKDLRNYQLDIEKMKQADTTTSYKEWKLAGMPGSYASFLKDSKVNGKPPTQDQSQSATYAVRMKDSNDTITRLTDQFTKLGLLDQAKQANLPSWMNSAEGQQMEQAQRDFVNAVLRKESGSAISSSEFDSAKKQYFPQPGDTADVLAQKAHSRKNALSGISNEAGPALSDEFRNNLDRITYASLDDYAKSNPTQINAIDKMGQEHPNWSDDDILQILQATPEKNGSGFSDVGGDTHQAAGNGKVDLDRLAEAIGKYESGGRYNALGPVLPSGSYAGDRAIGKYQIMGKNVPSWTKQALGYSMSPQEFRNDPEAQDKTAKFFMKKHLDKYRTGEDVASIWLSGKPVAGNQAKDLATGVTVPQYVKNVMKYYG